MKCCINGGNVIRLLFLSAKLLKFEMQKCGQILCAHKPYFLMPGHKCFHYSILGLKRTIPRLTVVSREAKEEVTCDTLSTDVHEYFSRTNLVKQKIPY